MSDNWEYRVIWEYAGLTPPDFHEDEIQSLSDTLNTIVFALYAASDSVTKELNALKASGISSTAFDALSDRWHQSGRNAIGDLAQTLGSLSSVLGDVLYEILKWKAHLFAAVGLADIAMTPAYVLTGGLAALGEHAGAGIGEAELKRKLENQVDELEGKLVSLVVDKTPLKSLQHRVGMELQKLVTETINDSGQAVGQYVKEIQ